MRCFVCIQYVPGATTWSEGGREEKNINHRIHRIHRIIKN